MFITFEFIYLRLMLVFTLRSSHFEMCAVNFGKGRKDRFMSFEMCNTIFFSIILVANPRDARKTSNDM